ncbi:hypothetical protein LOCC1_G007214 [Lachnellula occidentalis]|uniref:Uncharacterized protein n=1 Tax=Lachnellula occidentalis TaxID=215460 RepID=A0A8H8S2A3_9HELO|nr:hypothetical protein LOCC1_G007214 [Lachnellula occidentalis]
MAVGSLKRPNVLWAGSLFILFFIWFLWGLKTHFFPSAPWYSSIKNGVDHVKTAHFHNTTEVITSPNDRIDNKNGKNSGPSSNDQHSDDSTKTGDRPLILYAYHETDNARRNLEFFIAHALHDAADFIFVMNGETDAMKLLPKHSNIKYVERGNDCYDMGAFASVLVKDDLYKKYSRFITMNASIRGPFLPYWATGCWSDMFLSRITNEVKLVGITMNCKPLPHIQSMIWATDRVGIEVLLFPTETQIKALEASLPPFPDGEPVRTLEKAGINWCPHEYWDAVSVEVHGTPLIQAAGYKVDAMMVAFHKQAEFQASCKDDEAAQDPLYDEQYFGTNLHPFDTVFAKANRGSNAKTLDRLTEWTDGRNYTSYEYCH